MDLARVLKGNITAPSGSKSHSPLSFIPSTTSPKHHLQPNPFINSSNPLPNIPPCNVSRVAGKIDTDPIR